MREGQGRIASSVEDLWEEQPPRCMYNGESRTAEMSSISMWLRIVGSGEATLPVQQLIISSWVESGWGIFSPSLTQRGAPFMALRSFKISAMQTKTSQDL